MSRTSALSYARRETLGEALSDRPSLVVATIVTLSAALAAFFASQVVRFEPDELGYTHLAMGIAHSLSPFTTSYGGGQRLNQLYPLLIAPLWGAFGNVTAFQLTHLWNSLLMASAAVPAYLLARELSLPRWTAYLAAALVAFAPWLTLSTTQLTEVAAYPACAWALLAMQRSLAVPSPGRDLVALLAIALAAYGRLQLIVLAPAFVLAMLVHELAFALRAPSDAGSAGPGRRRGGLLGAGAGRDALREARSRILRGHALLSGAAAVGLLAGVPLLVSGRLASAAGFYGDALSGVTLNGATFGLARSYLAFIALGLGALPAALAAGFALETLIAPASRRVHAFFSLALVAIAVLTLQVAEVSVRFNGSTVQERYLFYIVPLLAVAMCAALLMTRRPAPMILAGALLLALVVGSTHYESERTAFWYQVSPGMTSFYDWLRPLFAGGSAPTADPGASRHVLAGLAVLALGALLALLALRLPRPRLLACVGSLLVLFCVAETTHALWRVVHGNASGAGFGGAGIQNADWVDRAVSADASVEQLLANLGGLDSAREVWEQASFWNRSLTLAYSVDTFDDPYLPTFRLSVDARSGTLRLAGSPAPRSDAQRRSPRDSAAAALSPRYLVVPVRGFPVEPLGRVLARSPSGSLQLMRASAPLRAAWAVTGVSSNGWLGLDRAATVRLYTLRDARRRCASVSVRLSLSYLAGAASRLSLSGSGAPPSAAWLQPGQTRTFSARACGRGSSLPQLRMSARPAAAESNAALAPQLVSVAVSPS